MSMQMPRPVTASRDVQILRRLWARHEGRRRHRALPASQSGNAIALCVYEMSRKRALDPTAQIPPMRPGLPEDTAHDSVRRSGHEFLSFMKTAANACHRIRMHVIPTSGS